MARFDEVELLSPLIVSEDTAPIETESDRRAGRIRRSSVFLSDLSLFVALAVALSTMISPLRMEDALPQWFALAGFLVLIAYFYHAGAWLLWGRTIGGAIFDLKITSIDGDSLDLSKASRRFAGMILSILLGGAGFLPGLLPSRKTLADQLSGTTAQSA